MSKNNVDINKLIDFDTMSVRWAEVLKIDEFKALQATKQSVKWHSEGNVLIHTMNVCACATETCKTNKWLNGSALGKLLITAALFHDIGKPLVSTYTDDWHSHGHERVSEQMTRMMLWCEDVQFREDVCKLVRHHMVPFNVLKNKNIASTIVSLSKNVPSLRLLIELKRCDVQGSEPADPVMKRFDLQSLDELERYATQLGCYDAPSKVPSKGQESEQEHRHRFKTKPHVHVNVMIGLPGAGKSTYVKKIMEARDPDTYTIISRDRIRAELGFTKSEDDKKSCPKHQEEAVSKVVKERLSDGAQRGMYIFIDLSLIHI